MGKKFKQEGYRLVETDEKTVPEKPEAEPKPKK